MRLSERERERSLCWSQTTNLVSENVVIDVLLYLVQSTNALLFAGHSIHKKLGINVVSDSIEGLYRDMFRGIRSQLAVLLDGLDPKDLATMSLGLSHSLSRYGPTLHTSMF